MNRSLLLLLLLLLLLFFSCSTIQHKKSEKELISLSSSLKLDTDTLLLNYNYGMNKEEVRKLTIELLNKGEIFNIYGEIFYAMKVYSDNIIEFKIEFVMKDDSLIGIKYIVPSNDTQFDKLFEYIKSNMKKNEEITGLCHIWQGSNSTLVVLKNNLDFLSSINISFLVIKNNTNIDEYCLK